MKLRHHTINELIKEREYTSYLEIGLADGVNFNAVKCKNKLGIDPDLSLFRYDKKDIKKITSDEFFEKNKKKFDLIFIDGLHHAEQVEKDIINAYECLNKGGAILVHDINPFTEEMTVVPRQQSQWTGDVFKVWAGVTQNTKLKTKYLEEKYGLGLIEKGRAKPKEGMTADITYKEFSENKYLYLHGAEAVES